METNSLPECLGRMKVQKTVAEKYGLPLICYEAGQHLVGVGGGENHEALTKLLVAGLAYSHRGLQGRRQFTSECVDSAGR